MTDHSADSPTQAAQTRARQRASRYHEVLRQVAQEAGGRLAGDDGTDVAHSVKDVASLSRKTGAASRERGSADQALLSVGDLNRYSILFDEHGYTAGVERARQLMEERGFTWERGKNTWDDPFYKGYNTRFRDQNQPHAALEPDRVDATAPRHPVEVQFHTPESFAAKSDNHDLYELTRSGELSRKERIAANELQARRSDRVPQPPGYERLPDQIPPEERQKDVPEPELERVRQRQAALRGERAAEQVEPARGPPLPATELRRLEPEASSGGQRVEAGDEGRDRGGLERI